MTKRDLTQSPHGDTEAGSAGEQLAVVPLFLAVLAAALGWRAVIAAPENGLVAHYNFDEGSGSVVHDLSGNKNHGTLHGAPFVQNGKGHALQFDGKDDYVDCGDDESLDLRRKFSIALWVRTKGPPGKGEPMIVGKNFTSYALTYGPRHCWFYGHHPYHAKAILTPGEWHHVAGSFEEGVITISVDGEVIHVVRSPHKETRKAGNLRMGTFYREANEFARGAFFKGFIDDVRIYSRAVNAEEVRHLFLTTNLSGVLDLRVTAVPPLKLMGATVNTRGLGKLPVGTTLRFDLVREDQVRDTITVRNVQTRSKHYVEFKTATLAPGTGQVRATALDKAGKSIGRGSVAKTRIEPPPAFPRTTPHGKILNNLVTEMVNIKDPPPARKSIRFTNPRHGWVFVSCTSDLGEGDRVTLSVKTGDEKQDWIRHDGAAPPPPAWQGSGPTREAMRLLPAGPHELLIDRSGGPKIRRIIVRAVKELTHIKAGVVPFLTPEGPRDFDYLEKHVLPHVNTFVYVSRFGLKPHHVPFVQQWKDAGRRAIAEASIPFMFGDRNSPVSVEHAYAFWKKFGGYKETLLDGIIADEFGGGYAEEAPAWTEAVLRIHKETGKSFYPYCGDLYLSPTLRPLLRAAVKTGGGIAWERYLKEQPTTGAAWRLMQDSLVHGAEGWRENAPDVFHRLITCFGYFAAPPETHNAEPGANFKVFMELETNMVATHPAFEGAGGFMRYISEFVDEETVRWAARLSRHYGIEGKTEMLSDDPYLLSHVRNPDFREGTTGWMVEAAEPEGIRADESPGFGWLQGRYPKGPEGDAVLVMRRSKKAPNRIRQTMKDLEPGRLYSLKLISADFNDMSVKETHALRIQIEGADLVPEKSYTHVFNNFYHVTPRYKKRKTAWMNYRRLVFRAGSSSAMLTISDWADDKEPGGRLGQETMMNFVEVQPYFSE